jgi:hypothetical protein
LKTAVNALQTTTAEPAAITDSGRKVGSDCSTNGLVKIMKTKLAIRSGAISLAAFLLLPASYAQNVGIGSSTPTEARLVVSGVGATGSFAPGEFFNNNSGPQLVTEGTGSGG